MPYKDRERQLQYLRRAGSYVPKTINSPAAYLLRHEERSGAPCMCGVCRVCVEMEAEESRKFEKLLDAGYYKAPTGSWPSALSRDYTVVYGGSFRGPI